MDYDGRRFSASAAETADASGASPVAVYHQRGDVVWAEFAGGAVAAGRLVGSCAADGSLTVAYSQVMTDGRVVAGSCRSTPEVLADGRIRLREEWTRHTPVPAGGVSHIEEIA